MRKRQSFLVKLRDFGARETKKHHEFPQSELESEKQTYSAMILKN